MEEKHHQEIIDATKEEVFNNLKDELRPEFLNRIDEKIMFMPLTKDEIKQILVLLMRKVKKMLGKQEIQIELTEKAKDFLADLGYDPQFGARPMKRVLQKELVNELSKQILSGAFGPGDTIHVDADKEGLVFTENPLEENETKSVKKKNGTDEPE